MIELSRRTGNEFMYNSVDELGKDGGKKIVALSGIAIPERTVEGERVQVEADDNIMLLMDHGDAVFSCVQTGFVYGAHRSDWTVELIGTEYRNARRQWQALSP